MMKKRFLVSIVLIVLTVTTVNAQWSELGRLHTYTHCVDNIGNVYAAGRWGGTGVETPLYMAKWNGVTWTPLDSNLVPLPYYSGYFKTSCLDSLNNIYIAGSFKNSAGKFCVGTWNGSNWVEVGTGVNSLAADSSIISICIDKAGNLYAAGAFVNSNGKKYVAKWNGINWTELGTGANSLAANSYIQNIYADNNGNIYASGSFRNSNGKHYLAKWDGVTWAEVGTGVNSLNANGEIYAVCVDDNGYIYAGGNFKNSNNKSYVAKWNGTSWSELGSGTGNDTLANARNIGHIDKDPSGNIYASVYMNRSFAYGDFYIIKWDGMGWSELGGTNSLTTDDDIDFCFDLQGNLYSSGAFNPVSRYYYCAKYTGAYNATYITSQNGDWNNPSTWLNGKVPYNGAKIIVRHNVTVNINAVCYSVSVEAGGNITVAPGIQFTILH